MNVIRDISFPTDVTTEPVPISQVKPYIDVNYVDANTDALLTMMVKAARRKLEKYTGLSFAPRVVKAIIAADELQELPYGPVGSITTVRIKTGETWTTLGAGDYTVIGDQFKYFCPAYPGIYEITYNAGFSALPEDLQEAICVEVGYQFENRGDDAKAGLSKRAKQQAELYRRMLTTS